MRPKFAVIVIFLALTAVACSRIFPADDSTRTAVSIALLPVLAQQLARYADDSAGGNADSFKSLSHARADIGKRLAQLKQIYAGKPAHFQEIEMAALQLDRDAAAVLDNQQQVLAIAAAAGEFDAKASLFNSRLDEAVKLLSEGTGTKDEVLITSREMRYMDRMQRRVQSVVRGGEEAPAAAAGLQRDAQFYGAVLGGLVDGNADLNIKKMSNAAAREILNDLRKQWQDMDPTIKGLLEASPAVQDARQAADKAQIDSQTFVLKADALLESLMTD